MCVEVYILCMQLFYNQYTLDKARYDQEMVHYLKSKQVVMPVTNQIADDNVVNPEL